MIDLRFTNLAMDLVSGRVPADWAKGFIHGCDERGECYAREGDALASLDLKYPKMSDSKLKELAAKQGLQAGK